MRPLSVSRCGNHWHSFCFQSGCKLYLRQQKNEGRTMIHSSKMGRWFLLLWISLLLGIPAFADDAKPGESATPAAPSAADKDAAKATPLPAYFSSANADENKPTWRPYRWRSRELGHARRRRHRRRAQQNVEPRFV